MTLMVRGFQIARRSRDEFGRLIATGITTWISVQALLNIGGITRVIPLTGVPLPFLSYGGNSLAAVMLAVGVLISISRYGEDRSSYTAPGERSRSWRPRRRRLATHRAEGALMRIALTGGGTGGHILPAVAVLEALRARCGGELDVCFFGPDNRGERAQVESHGIAFERVASAAVRGRGPLRVARGLATLAMGTWTASRKLRAFAPHAVFSTGGYGSFPGSVAARLGRRPLVVYLPDVLPGWAVKAERRLATRIATTTEAALAHLPAKKTTVTGYPVRSVFFSQSREEARAALGIPARAERVVVVAGATQGAHALNEAVFRALRGPRRRKHRLPHDWRGRFR